MKVHIGIDSTDSPTGGCTTYTMALLIDELHKLDPEITFLGYPRLIRLNPNIPQKTRGNAALGLTIVTNKLDIEDVKNKTKDVVNEQFFKHDDRSGKKPGIAIIVGDFEPNLLYEQALQHLILKELIFEKYSDIWLYPSDSNGTIGAAVACTSALHWDHSYELLTYRHPERRGSSREVNLELLQKLKQEEFDVFSSFDEINNRELIAPSGPDPVFCGVRGNNPLLLDNFFKGLKISEQLESMCLFISNQGTDDHVKNPQSSLKIYSVFSSVVSIHSKPVDLPGGHVNLKIRLNEEIVDTMVFQPTGELRKLVRKLSPGDIVHLTGNIKEYNDNISISVESIIVIDLVERYKVINHKCPNNHSMTKSGLFKGYKCNTCGYTELKRNLKLIQPKIYIGQRGLADLTAQRHLTQPLSRMNYKNMRSPTLSLNYEQIRTIF